MSPAIPDSKSALRREVQARLKALTPIQRAGLAAQARALLEQQAVWREAKSILFFAPTPEELDVWPLLRDALAAGKTAALPRFMPATGRYAACPVQDPGVDVTPGHLGIREPIARCAATLLTQLDLILVPGIAFDPHLHRLGRGKGFYDRLLAELQGRTCGVAFDQQIVAEVPVEAHDRRLDCLFTPTRWIEIK
ncbi:MAG TPA: 5-formyltetrahydrofolate cyclo-ligase [Verrucomicrobiae bacterium]|nr:5-formyltetrahydrofolate cyclo-ligase [Verrucomicrobiae bacterium]